MTQADTTPPPRPGPPRVSVVVPCFNLGNFLDEALDSVAAQTWTDFEVVVVDDGSTDPETRRLLESLDRPNTRLVRSENRGLPAARNLGIANSRGEFVCSLDADDRLEPSWIERAVQVLDSDPGLAFVSHWLDTFGDEHWEWKPDRCDLARLVDTNTINGAALVRRAVVEAVGGFDESMRGGCEDWEFWIRVVERGYRGAIVPEILYHYRRRPDSMSREMHRADRYLDLHADIVRKHAASYRRHLPDLVLRRERTVADLTASIRAVEEELDGWLQPARAERRREVGRARARLAEARVVEDRERPLREAEERVRALEEQVRALHQSWSWRITAPLRRLYEWAGLVRR
jgi:glycosyltransferase involved in cell wall biosynthesis